MFSTLLFNFITGVIKAQVPLLAHAGYLNGWFWHLR